MCVALADLIALTQPQVLRHAVDDLYRGVTAQKLAVYALILLGIAVVAGVFKYWMRQAVIGVSRHVEYDLRNDLFAHFERLPVAYFQRGRTGEMTFSPSSLIAYTSAIMTLEPGDVMMTGTPAGVGPLTSGDVVEVEVEGVGVLRNPVM